MGKIIKIVVKPGSGRFEIEKSGDHYIVFLKNRAHEGRANTELIKELGKFFKSDIRIIRGAKSREKIIEIINKE